MSLSTLPVELVSNIQRFLPAYQFYGDNPIALVSKRFNQAQYLHGVKAGKTSIQDILDSCKTPEDALYILTDEKLLAQLTYEDVLNVIATHPDIAIALINNAASLLREQDFRILGSKSHKVALQIQWRCPSASALFGQRLPCEFLEHYENARSCLDLPVFRKRLNARDLAVIGAYHPQLGIEILDAEDLRDRLDALNLLDIGSKNPAAARKILHSEPLKSKLDTDALAMIASRHLDLATGMLDAPYLRDKLSANVLVHIGKIHASVAQRIFNDSTLRNKLHGYHLGAIGKNHVAIAHYILDTEELRNKMSGLNLGDLGQLHCDIATRILDSDELKNRLDGTALAKLCARHFKLANRILDDEILRNKLVGNDPVILSSKYLKIAKRILQIEEIQDKLNGSQLTLLNNGNPKLLFDILNDEYLRMRIDYGVLDRNFNSSSRVTKTLLYTLKYKNVGKIRNLIEEVDKIYDAVFAAVKSIAKPQPTRRGHCIPNRVVKNPRSA